MIKRTCTKCIYAVKLSKTGLSLFVCANKQNLPGQLTLTDPEDYCTNFKAKKTVNRPKVNQPTDSDIRLIPLTQGKVAVVDAADYDRLSQYKWYANKKTSGYYAATRKNSKVLYMHREIMKYTLNPEPCTLNPNLFIDHIDRNPLNNRRSNLRFCTPRQNCFNQRPKLGTSKYKGVCWHKKQKAWAAIIEMNGKATHLGFFRSESDAAKAYDAMAKKIFGQYAYLNFPK